MKTAEKAFVAVGSQISGMLSAFQTKTPHMQALEQLVESEPKTTPGAGTVLPLHPHTESAQGNE